MIEIVAVCALAALAWVSWHSARNTRGVAADALATLEREREATDKRFERLIVDIVERVDARQADADKRLIEISASQAQLTDERYGDMLDRIMHACGVRFAGMAELQEKIEQYTDPTVRDRERAVLVDGENENDDWVDHHGAPVLTPEQLFAAREDAIDRAQAEDDV